MAVSGDEVLRPHGKECRERIGVRRVCGQERLRTVELLVFCAIHFGRLGILVCGRWR